MVPVPSARWCLIGLLICLLGHITAETAQWRFGDDVLVEIPVSTRTIGRVRTIVLFPPFGAIASVETSAAKDDLDYTYLAGKNILDIRVLNPAIDQWVRVLDSYNNLIKLRIVPATAADGPVDGTFILIPAHDAQSTVTTFASDNGINLNGSTSESQPLPDTYSGISILTKHIYGEDIRPDVRSAPVYTVDDQGHTTPGRILYRDDQFVARLMRVWQAPNMRVMEVIITPPGDKPVRVNYERLRLGHAIAVLNDDGFDLDDPAGSQELIPGKPLTFLYFFR